MKYLFQAIGYIIMAILAFPFFILGALVYIFIGFPVIAGWEFGEDVVSKLTEPDGSIWRARFQPEPEEGE